jgi:hypothetical protein
MIKKLLCAILLGAIATIYFVQNDQWAHDQVAQKIKLFFESSYDCSVSFKVKDVNAFDLSVTLEDVSVGAKNRLLNAHNQQWQWQAQQMKLGLSWISLLGGLLGLEITLDGVEGNSTLADGHIAILEQHVRKYIDGPALDIPVYLKSLTFKNSTLHIDGAQPHLACTLKWDSESKRVNDLLKTTVFLHDGSFGIMERHIFSHIAGTINVDMASSPHGYIITSNSSCSADLEYMPAGKKACFINGSWSHDKGLYTIKNADHSLDIERVALEIVDSQIKVDAKAQVPFSFVVRMASPELSEMPLNGLCTINLKTAFAPGLQEVHGTLISDPILYKAIKIADQMRISFNRENQKWHGIATVERAPLISLNGSWQWDEEPVKGHIELVNTDSKIIPGFSLWRLAQKNLNLSIDVDENSTISGSYKCLAENDKQEDKLAIVGSFLIKESEITVDGRANKATYHAQISLLPTLRIKKLEYLDEHKNPFISLNAAPGNNDHIKGILNFSLFQLMVHNCLNYDLQGQGLLALNATIKDDIVHMNAQLEQGGTIRLPQTYNVMSNFDADIDVNMTQNQVVLNSLNCKLLRGALQSERAVAYFNDQYELTYAYLPVTFDSCLLNLKKDLYAVFSGSMSLTKKDNALPFLKGNVILDRSQLNENLFSDKFQRSLFAYTGSMFDTSSNDMKCDIKIETKQPIRVDTALLQATAKVGMHITNTIQDPHVSGLVEVLSGALQFPYRPLNISKGSIYFMPHQLYDPIIEFTAKNKIKKYSVSLQVSGSLQNHHISLESTPPLSEEQIIALLLVGSQEESLNVMMPALIAQNLKTLIFDSDQSPLKVDSYFQSWLKPFKNIHLVPSFTDQTGRGGLRGAIEIDINDRTRALIQKNFNLTEDTRLEVEYLLSDDVSIRGIRDERKDVGGEVEMRWKFGG